MSRHFPFLVAPTVRQIAPIRLAIPAGNRMSQCSRLNPENHKKSKKPNVPVTKKVRLMAMPQLPENEENVNQSG